MIRSVLFTLFLLSSLSVFSQKELENVYAAPNPFFNTTKIHVKSKTPQDVLLTVRNVLGKTVYRKKLKLKKGQNRIPFSKNKLRSGVYLYSLKSKKELISKRLVIQ